MYRNLDLLSNLCINTQQRGCVFLNKFCARTAIRRISLTGARLYPYYTLSEARGARHSFIRCTLLIHILVSTLYGMTTFAYSTCVQDTMTLGNALEMIAHVADKAKGKANEAKQRMKMDEDHRLEIPHKDLTIQVRPALSREYCLVIDMIHSS